MKAVVLLSGGMDSVTLFYHLLDKGYDLAVISFDYGSKHNAKEIEMARYHTDQNSVSHVVIELPFINDLFKSDLLRSGGVIPEGHYEDEMMKSTVVPFRNGIMLSIAVGYAESIDADMLAIASHAGDHAIYPDCRPEFNEVFGYAMRIGTYREVQLYAPFQNMTKREVAVLGKKLGVDYSKTWSCYKGEDKPCGKCGTCVERMEALAGL